MVLPGKIESFFLFVCVFSFFLTLPSFESYVCLRLENLECSRGLDCAFNAKELTNDFG